MLIDRRTFTVTFVSCTVPIKLYGFRNQFVSYPCLSSVILFRVIVLTLVELRQNVLSYFLLEICKLRCSDLIDLKDCEIDKILFTSAGPEKSFSSLATFTSV